MANLLGNNIGTNYKGILNLDSTINTPLDTTLRAVTDGMGTASPLKLSTTNVEASKVVFTDGILSRDVNDATGLRLFGGTLITTNDSGYIYLQRDTTNFGAPIFGLANGNFDSNFFRWERNGTEIARLTATGNWYMGSGGVTPTARVHVRGDAATNVGYFETSASGEIVTIGVSGGNTTRFNGAVRSDVINDYANGYTMVQYVSGTQIRFGSDSLRLNPTTLEAIFNGTIRAASLPTTRPATVGDLYQDTAANILANGDLVVGIRQ